MKKILIFGSSGRLGSYLVKELKSFFCIYSIGKKNNKYKVNLLKFREVYEIINLINPDLIINCAASTNVNKCIKNYSYGFKGNVLIPRNIVQAIKKFTLFIFLQIKFTMENKIKKIKKQMLNYQTIIQKLNF